jgi:hypothetical protein
LDLTNAVAIAAASYHSLALRSDGTIVAWGDNSYGQIEIPPDVTNIIGVSAQGINSVALKDDGTVVRWGRYSDGTELLVPPGVSNVVAIVAGVWDLVALQAGGTVISWGKNYYGETNIPPSLTNAIAVAAGWGDIQIIIGNGPPVQHSQLRNPALSNGHFLASIQTQPARVYALEYKNSLADTNWVALPLVAGTGKIVTLRDPTATSSQRFYRVRRW